ncbi:hypothetical protein QJS66_06310 [Kocuria rhizophila]|nr:hypothetical protein QJS66_06310 [Kocuria rhizophila]
MADWSRRSPSLPKHRSRDTDDVPRSASRDPASTSAGGARRRGIHRGGRGGGLQDLRRPDLALVVNAGPGVRRRGPVHLLSNRVAAAPCTGPWASGAATARRGSLRRRERVHGPPRDSKTPIPRRSSWAGSWASARGCGGALHRADLGSSCPWTWCAWRSRGGACARGRTGRRTAGRGRPS